MHWQTKKIQNKTLHDIVFHIYNAKLDKDTAQSHANEKTQLLLDFSLTVKAATLIFISGCGSAIPSAKEGKSGFIYNLVKN